MTDIKTAIDEEATDDSSQVVFSIDIVSRNAQLTQDQRRALSRFVRDQAKQMNAAVTVLLSTYAKVRVQRSTSMSGNYFIEFTDD